MTIDNVTIGSDPELFIINTKTNKVKSAVKLIPGTKENPVVIPELGDGYAIQTDNILAEFNIPATDNCTDFVISIEKMKSYIRNYVKNINPNYDILCAASQIVPSSELKSKQAKMFGCSKDYCIYTQEVNPVPKDASKTNLRSAGFHIHCGYNKPTIDRSLRILRYFDAVLGLPSIIYDNDNQRRTLYGKAGCFRLCDYGFEYRTLSSYWIDNPDRISWIWNQIKLALNMAKNEFCLPEGNVIQECINNNDVELAKKICKEYGLCAEFSV